MSSLPKDQLDLPESNGQPVLTIDLAALKANYLYLRGQACRAKTAGVVKAGGYGCGATEVARALKEVGCDLLFVANTDEGRELREHRDLANIAICVLNGCQKSEEEIFQYNKLIPILNSLDDYKRWMSLRTGRGSPPPFALHFDTGMNRLGMSLEDTATIIGDSHFRPAPIVFAMSHLTSADTPASDHNRQQAEAFTVAVSKLRKIHLGLPLSLANSAGIFLGPDYCLDIVRPGIALYGGQPISGRRLPLSPVAHLHAPVLQVRNIEKGESVGYGQSYIAARKSRIATLPLGYADGILSGTGNNGYGFINGARAPMVGRISMDLITIDVTDFPEENVRPGTYVEILGENVTIDQLGAASGSFGYEILTGLGNRYRRRHINQPDPGPSAAK